MTTVTEMGKEVFHFIVQKKFKKYGGQVPSLLKIDSNFWCDSSNSVFHPYLKLTNLLFIVTLKVKVKVVMRKSFTVSDLRCDVSMISLYFGSGTDFRMWNSSLSKIKPYTILRKLNWKCKNILSKFKWNYKSM